MALICESKCCDSKYQLLWGEYTVAYSGTNRPMQNATIYLDIYWVWESGKILYIIRPSYMVRDFDQNKSEPALDRLWVMKGDNPECLSPLPRSIQENKWFYHLIQELAVCILVFQDVKSVTNIWMIFWTKVTCLSTETNKWTTLFFLYFILILHINCLFWHYVEIALENYSHMWTNFKKLVCLGQAQILILPWVVWLDFKRSD